MMPRPLARMVRFSLAALLALLTAPSLHAQHTAGAACGPPVPVLFANGFDVESAAPSDPSNGSGGAFPGPQQRTISVAGVGLKTYYLHIPASYSPARPVPVLVALNGAPGSPALADTYAQALRFDWSFSANPGGFIVVAPVASGSQGGWVPGVDESSIEATLADVEALYNVERTRRYLWGFSAGANFGHDVVLRRPGVFAAYGVSGGSLAYYACDRVGTPSCAQLLSGVPRHIPVQIHIGQSDPRYPVVSGDPARFTNAGWAPDEELRYSEFAGGHVYTLDVLAEAWAHACRFAVVP